MIYFIKIDPEHVKIGYSIKPFNRLGQLQGGSAATLKMLAILPGGRETEKAIHNRFSEHRVRGEIYRLAGALAKYVDALPEAGQSYQDNFAIRLARTPKGGAIRYNSVFEIAPSMPHFVKACLLAKAHGVQVVRNALDTPKEGFAALIVDMQEYGEC